MSYVTFKDGEVAETVTITDGEVKETVTFGDGEAVETVTFADGEIDGVISMIFTVAVGDGGSFALPLVSDGTYDFTVNWGDGDSDDIAAWDAAAKTHTYSTAGTYTVVITGTLYGFRFANGGSKLLIRDIKSWGYGVFRLGNGNGYFYGCTNLTVSATGPLDLAGTSTMYQAFRNCYNITTIPSINNWDFSSVTSIHSMFKGCSNFNQDLNGIDVSNVTNMGAVFEDCSLFDGNINNWDTSNVTNMFSMFWDASVFNQDISAWNVGNVTSFYQMFYNADLFNQDISGWDVGSAETFGYMLACDAFNQDISGWDIGSAYQISSMFRGAESFDQNIGSWDVTSITQAGDMFSGTIGLSTANYDALLIGWEAQAVQDNVQLNVNQMYSAGAAATARAALIADHNWSITDGGLAP